MPEQKRAQHHDAALIVQLVGGVTDSLLQDKSRQPIERKNVQPGVTGQFPAGEQLAFELERRLFGHQQNQRRAIGIVPQRGADFGETTERLAAAGRTEEKARLHTGFFAQSRGGAKQFIGAGMHFLQSYFLFPFSGFDYACRRWKNSNSIQRRKKAKSMPLTHTKDLFAKALKGKYALGAFNVNNMELLQAIVEACEEEKAPVMLQISKGARQYANPVYLKKLIEAAVSLSNIPIAVHLDHGDSFELCKDCIDEGFTSVMIDASHEPFEKNVEICRKVVEYAHKHNCVVEGELGHLVGAQFDEGEEGGATPPAAITPTRRKRSNSSRNPAWIRWPSPSATRTAPTSSRAKQHLDLERLKPSRRRSWTPAWAIIRWCCTALRACPRTSSRKSTNTAASWARTPPGVPEADIEVARRIGCTKVNIDTDLRLAMTAAIRKVFAENPKEFDPRKYLGPARAKVKELVRHKVSDVLCCAGHAFD